MSLLSPWGSLSQDLRSINLSAIEDTSMLFSLIQMSESCCVVSDDSLEFKDVAEAEKEKR